MHSFTVLAAFCAIVPGLAFPQYARSNTKTDPEACFPLPRAPVRAPLISTNFNYTGARIDGKNGTEKGGVPVPLPGDKDHEFQHPAPGAYRGPCPGLNTAANHGFLSRDGFTTYDELVSMHQNMYNIAYDLAVPLSALGVAADGNIHTDTMSIGKDPSCLGMGDALGLWYHDTFETDTSLTRNDYYLDPNHDNHSFNGTLFRMMRESIEITSNSTKREDLRYDLQGLASFRGQRYDQCRADNGQFHFGINALILFGASSFLFEVFPGAKGVPDYDTITSFYGAKENSTGGYDFIGERIPAGWKNRVEPYTLYELGKNIRDQYLLHKRPLGHNTGRANFTDDVRQFPDNGTATDMVCFLYYQITDSWAGEPSTGQPVEISNYIKKKINPHFGKLGCNVSEPILELTSL